MNVKRMLGVALSGLLVALILVTCSGCSTGGSNNGGTYAPGWVEESEFYDPWGSVFDSFKTNSTNFVSRAVVAGLTYVNPAAYGGWNGDCPGCDVDVATFAAMCREEGAQTATLLNDQATRKACVEAARKAGKGMRPGDLLILYYSGHGGQIRDTSGDEEDGQDETICLYDGELDDDMIAKLLEDVPPGVRVWFITDSCNSGTNYKSRRSLRRAVPRTFEGMLIHYGGCADGESSYGGMFGGVFTGTMEEVKDELERPVSYVEFFSRVKEKMPRDQTPTIGEYGKVSNAFRLQRVFH